MSSLGRQGPAVLLLMTGLGCVAPAPEVGRPAAEAVAERPSRSERSQHAEQSDRPEQAAFDAAKRPALEEVLEPSLVYLERGGTAWMRGESDLNLGDGCISCHVVSFSLWSHNAAARRGLSVESEAFDRLTDEAMEFIARPGIGRAVTWGQLLLGRSSRAEDSEYDWGAMVDGLVASQERAGHWRARGQFPDQRRSIEESDAVATMWSLLALDSMAREGGYESRALSWLDESANGVSSEWLAMRLLTDLRVAEVSIEDLVARVIDEQRVDGGWSWLLSESPNGVSDPSNAYSTGVALYALRQAGLSPSHPAVLAAVDYLLATQGNDGTWEVPSRLICAKPSDAKDTIYRYWGTAWAVIGLAEMLDEPASLPAAS